MINRGNTLYFCGLNPIWQAGVSRKTQTSDLRPRKTSDPAPFFENDLSNSSRFLSPEMFYSHAMFIDNSRPERSQIFIFSGLSLSKRSHSEKLMYQSNRSFNISPRAIPRPFEFLENQIPPSRGRKAVQMPHHRSIPGDQMLPPPRETFR